MITDHAFDDRWPERAGVPVKKSKLMRALQIRLTSLAQSDGIRLDKTGAGRVKVYPWLYAAVRMTDRGWLVMTFLFGDESEGRYEKAVQARGCEKAQVRG